MARPRSITSQRLLDAAAAVVAEVGPGFTVAQVARRAGVSVGSVAGRFGSKHGLLAALSRAGTRQALELMRVAAEAAPDPRVAVRDALVAVYASLSDPCAAANHLGQLGADIADPELRELLADHYAAVEEHLCALVADTVGPGWRGPPPRHAARVLLAVANGTALGWSVRPVGDLAVRLTDDIDTTTRDWWT